MMLLTEIRINSAWVKMKVILYYRRGQFYICKQTHFSISDCLPMYLFFQFSFELIFKKHLIDSFINKWIKLNLWCVHFTFVWQSWLYPFWKHFLTQMVDLQGYYKSNNGMFETLKYLILKSLQQIPHFK